MKHCLLLLALLCSPGPQAALHEENVDYKAGDKALKGKVFVLEQFSCLYANKFR